MLHHRYLRFITSIVPLLVSLGISLAPRSALAAARLEGTVRDATNGTPLAEVAVAAKGPPGVFHAATDSTGQFWLDLPAGIHELTARRVGYETATLPLTLVDGNTLHRMIALLPAPIWMAEQEVMAEAPAKPGPDRAPVTIDVAWIKRMPRLIEPDPIRSLQLLPGVQSASDLSSALYVRGTGPDHLLVLLDRTPLYNPTHAFGIFSSLNMDALEKVDLYKSAYPAEYGGRLGGVLEMHSRDGDREKFHGRGGTSAISGRLTLEGPVKSGSWIVSARRTHLDPILSLLRKHEPEIPAYYFYDLNGRLTQKISPNDQLWVSAYAGRDRLRIELPDDASIGVRWGNRLVTSRWARRFGPDWVGTFGASASQYESETRASVLESVLRYANRVVDLTMHGEVEYAGADAHRITAGLEGKRLSFGFDQDFNGTRESSLRQNPHLVAAYLEDLWLSRWGTSLRSGLRCEHFSEGNRWTGEPRVTVQHPLGRSFHLNLAGGMYHQPLQLVSTEIYSGGDLWVPVDRSAPLGRSVQTSVGLSWEPRAEYTLSVEAYAGRFRNLLFFDNDAVSDMQGTSTEDLFKTGGRGATHGLELFAERRIGRWSGWIGYTWARSRRKFPELNEGKEFPPKYDRRHDLKLVSDVEMGRWSVSAEFILGSGQAFTPAGARYALRDPGTGGNPDAMLLPTERNSERLLPFHRLDVTCSRRGVFLGAKVEYWLQIFNVYNRRNEWFVAYDTDQSVTDADVVHMLPLLPSFGMNFEF